MPIRMMRLTVAEVLHGGTRREFYDDLRQSLDLSRIAANLCVTECVRQDDLQLEKCGKIYTYPAISSLFPGATNSAASLSRSVESAYLQDRYRVKTGQRSVRVYRAFAWPLLSNNSYSTIRIIDEGEYLAASIRLLNGWWTVRLSGGPQYTPQNRILRKAVAEESYGDSQIYLDSKHRATLNISCRLDASESVDSCGEMRVASSRESLLVASLPNTDRPFVVNADVIKSWQSEADRSYQRLRQDCKIGSNVRKLRRAMNNVSAKRNNRMNTLCHEVSSQVVNKAIRCKVESIRLKKLRSMEKHYHAMFQDHRVTGEWFLAEPILAWLREMGWLGNAGNLSQITQVLDMS